MDRRSRSALAALLHGLKEFCFLSFRTLEQFHGVMLEDTPNASDRPVLQKTMVKAIPLGRRYLGLERAGAY